MSDAPHGERAADLCVLIVLGKPMPADLTQPERELWQQMVGEVAEARRKGYAIEIPPP